MESHEAAEAEQKAQKELLIDIALKNESSSKAMQEELYESRQKLETVKNELVTSATKFELLSH